MMLDLPMTPRAQATKEKKAVLHQNEKLYIKGHNQQSKKAIHGMGEIICKSFI